MARDLIEARDVPVNQAYRVVNIDRKTYRYSPKKKMDDTML